MERRRQRKEYPASFMSDDLIGLWESNGSQPITAEQPGGFWGMSWYSPPSEQHAEYGWFGWGDDAATHASESVGPTYDAAEMGGVQGFFGSPLRTLLAREVNLDQSADLSADGAMYCDGFYDGSMSEFGFGMEWDGGYGEGLGAAAGEM